MSQVATASSRNKKPRLLRSGLARLSDLADFPGSPVPDLFVDGKTGADSRSGLSWDDALDTMAAALAKAQTGQRIFFRGDIREEIVGSNLLFDVTIVGAGGLHHPDEPSSAYHPGSSTWRPPSSPTSETPLLEVRGRGWTFVNVFFDCPVDAAGVKLSRNADSGEDEYDASHASFINCRFVDGKYAIEDSGGCYNITIDGCEFKAFTTAAIANTSTSVANPLNWKIRNCLFPSNTSDFGNATHIDSPLNSGHILDNVFGTVRSTALYIDLTGGNNNIVTRNLLAGEYNTNDYVPGTGDIWAGNQSLSASFGGNSAQGTTLAAPAAAT